ncbi:MAG: hypothetical protein RLZZ230_603 [Candidatus Parcubacteria bacterium]|jgi:hypothetical protein
MYMNAKNIVITILMLVLAGAIGYFIFTNGGDMTASNPDKTPATEPETSPTQSTTTEEANEPVAETKAERGGETIIGKSVAGNPITAYHFGTGEKELLFIGGIHGGYSWNTTLVGYELVDYLDANPDIIPDNVTVTVIPALNPDGLKATVGTVGRFDEAKAITISDTIRVAGRFNTNKVDLNRNFDCEWTASGVWQSKPVSGGSAPFSEPEAQAVRDYITANKPAAAVVWFSSEGKVYPSACDTTPSKASVELAATYASAAGYGVEAKFDAYAITGDMVNWIAKQDVPAISVLLTNHKNTEWDKNKAGVEAVINTFAKQ